MKHLSKILTAVTFFILAGTSVFAADAVILSVIGTVEIGKDGTWKPAARGSIVTEGDLISTGFKSEALIKFNDATLKLGSLTQVNLEQLVSSQKKDTATVYLKTGSVRSTVTHTSNKKVSYTVRNPVAVASVRGTDYTFLSDAHIRCDSGAVVVYPSVLFNAAEHGIKNPADGQQGANQDQINFVEQLTPAEGTSGELTDKNDVDPSYKGGGILLTEGNSTDFTGWNPNQPTDPKDKNSETLVNLDGGFETVSGDTPGLNDTKQNKSASLAVTIKIKD